LGVGCWVLGVGCEGWITGDSKAKPFQEFLTPSRERNTNTVVGKRHKWRMGGYKREGMEKKRGGKIW
jgi:hypothetical protein